MMQTVIACVITAVVALIIGIPIGIQIRKRTAEKEINSAEEEAKRIINESIKSAESKKREALVEAKEEILQARNEYEREVKERRAENFTSYEISKRSMAFSSPMLPICTISSISTLRPANLFAMLYKIGRAHV